MVDSVSGNSQACIKNTFLFEVGSGMLKPARGAQENKTSTSSEVFVGLCKVSVDRNEETCSAGLMTGSVIFILGPEC